MDSGNHYQTPRFDPAQAGWIQRRSNPFFDVIAPFWHKQEGDAFSFGMECTPNTLNNSGNMHGGAITAFCDQALGGTIIEAVRLVEGTDAPPARSVTVQLNMQFLAAVRPHDFLVCKCRIIRRTRSLVFLDGLVEVNGNAVAATQAVFKLVRPAE